MEKILHCEICKGQSFRKLFNVSDFRLKTTDKIFSLEQCQDCGHVVLTPKPNENQLNSYYPNAFYCSSKRSVLDHINHKVVLDRIARNVMRGKLLDIGCGSGEFLKAAAEYGYEVYGQEVSSEAARLARENHGKVIFNKNLLDCKFESDYFDVITLWHVAEHIHDVNAYLNEIYRILKPKGLLSIEVPNFNCIERKIFKNYSLCIDAPRHLRHFTKETLKKILIDSGFECEINNGWSFLVSPLSILSSGNNFLYAKIKGNKADFICRLAFLPLLLFSGLNSLISTFSQTKTVIGARCTKL